MSINSQNTYLNIEDAHLRLRTGNVYAQGINIGGITVDTAHGLQRVSDTGNVTSNTLQFANATTAFVTTANVTVGRDLTVTGNATVSSNLTVTGNTLISDDLTVTENLLVSNNLTVTGNLNVTGNTFYTNPAAVLVDSNVVAEYTGPHDRPLRKYPEVAMTQNDESATSGYVADQTAYSGNADGYAYRLFDHSLSTAYQSGGSQYSGGDSTSSAQTTTATDGTTHQGVAITLDLATKIRLSYAKITSHTYYGRTPVEGTFLGSNNNSTWDVIGTFAGLSTTASGQTHTVHIADYATKSAYRYIRLVVTKVHTSAVQNGGSLLEFKELEYYGHEEGSGSLDTTLKSVYNVPATTGTQLEVYYDGQDFSGTPTSITDRSTNNITATANNITIDTTYKSFEITSSPRSNIIADNVTFVSGDEAHTYTLWVRLKNIQQRNLLIDYRPDGGTSTTGNAAGILIDNYNQRIQFYHQAADIELAYNFVTNTWYHITCSYSGGGNNTTNSKIYINGVEQTNIYVPTSAQLTTLSLPTTGKLTIGDYLYGGSYGMGDGNIANVRLYSKALNADQVKELYDYQKDYFLGSKSQVTLYKGHLGVGVTEPSGQLELAGDERIQEYPPRAMTKNETLVEGHGVFSALGGIGGETYAPWKAFDKSTSTFWIDVGIRYSDVTPFGALSTASKTTLYDGSVLSGGWIDLECPYPVKLKRVGTAPRTNYPSIGLQRGIILGSNNGVDWYQIDTIDYAGTTPPNTLTYFDITTETYYSHLRLVCTNLTARYPASGTSDMHWQMGELVYFGTPGPTTLDKGSLTLGRSLDVPRVSRYDVDTETPRPEKLVVDFDTTVNSTPTDISGQGNHGTFYNGASYSAADKAFNFDGTDDYITTSALGFSGDQVHSISLWFWSDKPQTDMTTEHGLYGVDGSNSDPTARHGLSWWSPVTRPSAPLRYWHSGSSGKNFVGARFVQNTWNHIMVVYPGGGAFNVRVWLNGVEQQGTDGGPTNNNLDWNTSDDIIIGDWYSAGVPRGQSPWDGKMSNFRVYSVALEPSEVKKLYRLGRTGRSMVISDTAVGIGKAPEAQLDVRGNLNVDGIITQPNQPMFSVSFPASTNGYVSVGNDINWTNIEIDTHNAYSAPNYTIPVSGYWYFFSHLYSDSSGTSDDEVKMVFNSTSSITGNGTAYSRTKNTGFGNLILQSIRYSTAGETVKISVGLGRAHYNSSAIAYFRGFMIG
jgi:hypothetical protein